MFRTGRGSPLCSFQLHHRPLYTSTASPHQACASLTLAEVRGVTGRTHEVTTRSLTYSIWHIPNTKEGHVNQPLKRAPRVGFWGSFRITECVIKLQARENDGATNYITSRMKQFLSLRDVNARRSEPLCSVPPSRQPMFVDWYASCPEFPWPVGNHQAEGTFCCFHVTWMFVTIFTKLRYNSPPGMFIRCSSWCSNTPFCKIFIAQSI